ncbi:uncharacterized protein LOC114874099 [Osmia bicornis bicornis]|uniref:uncharacterized protein LOC114874099 n=1 Tax=Osmia bicornis bicornis TaxID=1437191 RepID=UPI001EAF5243|nr:uncharacterized protein LOC114874099 [Osmia bicornis bicornis]
MFKNITPEKAIAFTRYSVALTCCWPLFSHATMFQLIRFRISRSAVLLNAFLLFLPLIYSLYINYVHNDHVGFSKSICLFLAVSQVLLNTFVCIVQQDRFWELIVEMKKCCKEAKPYERQVYQTYVDKYSTFYGVSAIWFYLTASIIAIGTLFIPQPLPTNAEYPFPVDYQPLKGILFLHQSFLGFQCSAHVCINMFCALLMLFAAARFEILKVELREVKNFNELVDCVKKYYIARRYAKKVSSASRFIALNTVMMCGTVLVFCGVNFIERQSSTVIIQFMSLAGTGLIEVFMVAWPADHLLDLSENSMRGIYESRWYLQSTSMQKHMLIMLLPQAPVGIKILYIIPTLSLNYYCSFVSNVISLFTVLRATIQKDDT